CRNLRQLTSHRHTPKPLSYPSCPLTLTPAPAPDLPCHGGTPMFSCWLSSLFPKKGSQKRRTARPSLLALEDRFAPAVAFALSGTATVGYGFDLNPAADRVRVVAGSLNFRVNPNTGAPIDGDNTGLTSGTVTGTNPDGPINTGTTNVDAAAYTNDQPNNGNVT